MKLLSLDAETNGLWGYPFSVAAIVYEEVDTFEVFTQEYSEDGRFGSAYSTGYTDSPWKGERSLKGSNGYAAEFCVPVKKMRETARFIARLPNEVVTNQWVMENVLPNLVDVPVTHTSYKEMLTDFAAFYMEHKDRADVICHMGYIVEAYLLREMHRLGLIGDWDAPFPLYDISGNLQQAGENPSSVDAYAEKYNLDVAKYGSTHNPLYDCEVTAKVYMHLRKHN